MVRAALHQAKQRSGSSEDQAKHGFPFPGAATFLNILSWIPLPTATTMFQSFRMLMLFFSKGEHCYKPKPHLQHSLTLAWCSQQLNSNWQWSNNDHGDGAHHVHMDTLFLSSEGTDSVHKSGEQSPQRISLSEKQSRVMESQGPMKEGWEKLECQHLVHCPSFIPLKVKSRAGKLRAWQASSVLDI